MGIQLPDLAGRIAMDLNPMKIAFGEVRAMSRAASKEVTDAFTGPAVKSRFTDFEQSVRSGMADAIKSMRDEAKRVKVGEEVKLRLYGPAQAEADVATARRAVTEIATEAKTVAGGVKGFL